jgi:CheY-like chemotaxis protein
MKKDFYIYKCLREIHRLNQAKLLEEKQHGILLILNTPGSLEHFMVHTEAEKIQTIFDTILNYVIHHHKKGSIEFGYKLGRDEELSFYVNEPISTGLEQSRFENEFEVEAELISSLREKLYNLRGRIWIDKNPVRGRTFWFTLDIQPPENRRNEELNNHASIPQPDWSNRTILIVDDVRTNLLLLEGFLTPTKASVISVDNGLKAVNAVKKDNSIDFVLMDVRMPVLDGYEATRRIKRIKPWLPVLAISAYPGSAETEIWKRAGCNAFLGKPLNSNDLICAMQTLFDNVTVKT